MSKTPFLDSLLASNESVSATHPLRPNEEAFAVLLLLAFMSFGGVFAFLKTVYEMLIEPKARQKLPVNDTAAGLGFIESVGDQLAANGVGAVRPLHIQDGFPILPESNNTPSQGDSTPLRYPVSDALREAIERVDAVERRSLINSRVQPDVLTVQQPVYTESSSERLEDFFSGTVATARNSREMQRNNKTLSAKDRLQRIQSETRMQLLDQREICRNKGLEAVQRWEQDKKGRRNMRNEQQGEQDYEEMEVDGRTILWMADDA